MRPALTRRTLLALTPAALLAGDSARNDRTPEGEGLAVDVRDFGARGDGTTDDAPALQRALDAALRNGSGTVRIPSGRYRLATAVRALGRRRMQALTLTGDGVGTKLLVATGLPKAPGDYEDQCSPTDPALPGPAFKPALSFHCFENVTLSDLTFVGEEGSEVSDASVTIRMLNVQQAQVVACNFYGLASLETGGAIVSAALSDLIVDRCTFRGCATNSGVEAPIIDNERWRGVTIRNTWFIDYGNLDGSYYAKTTVASPAAFVRIGDPLARDNALGQSEVHLDNVRVDEGCYRALFVHASPDGERVASVRVRGLQVNGNGADGATAVHVQNTDNLDVDSTWIGYRKRPGGRAFALIGVEDTRLSRVRTEPNTGLLTADVTCGRVVLDRSAIAVVESSARSTSAS